MNDEPTEPLGRVPAPPIDDELFGTGAAPLVDYRPVTTGGAHRRADDDDVERRWPWVAALAVLAVLGLAGLGWLLARVPHPDYRQANPAGSPSASSAPTSAEATTGSTEPAPTVTAMATSAPPTGAPISTPPLITPPSTRTTVRSPTSRPSPTLPSTVTVPNVVGKREGAAAAMLRSAGFSVATASVPTDKRRDIGKVLSQAPGGGSSARRGSVVTIFVGASATTR
jgi:hypothetical protein